MPDIVIWDIDNCLADDAWRIPRIDWSETHPDKRYDPYHAHCHLDNPGPLEAFRSWHPKPSAAPSPLFVTARPESVRGKTLLWLRMHLGVSLPQVLMRHANDRRPTAVLKHAVVSQVMRSANILAAYDDHHGVIEVYKQLGLNAIRLAIHDVDAYNPPGSQP